MKLIHMIVTNYITDLTLAYLRTLIRRIDMLDFRLKRDRELYILFGG